MSFCSSSITTHALVSTGLLVSNFPRYYLGHYLNHRQGSTDTAGFSPLHRCRGRHFVVSNPVRAPSLRPSPSGPFSSDAFATGGPPRIRAFHRYPRSTSDVSRPQDQQYPLQAERLGRPISQGTCWSGYERFRPNNRDHHLGCWYYRGGWHQTYPALIPEAS